MKGLVNIGFLLLLTISTGKVFSQKLVEHYNPLKKESIRTGTGTQDFMPYIQSGFTLMLPESKDVKGVLILEGSRYDQKNKSAKQLYKQAMKERFAVLSVSTEIPLDFYFSKSSLLAAHQLIQEAFSKYNLPNKNVFFLGASLVGHRAMHYIKFMRESKDDFQLNIKGIVMCNFTLDFTRKWYQHQRDIRINKINLWESNFINYLLETHLKGTPKTNPEAYHDFSVYSYFDEQNRNITTYKDFAIRAYMEPAINYRLKKYFRTLYENNLTDIVGFLAELRLVGNENTELILLQPEDNPSQKKNAQATWDVINKDELMMWIVKQVKN